MPTFFVRIFAGTSFGILSIAFLNNSINEDLNAPAGRSYLNPVIPIESM